MDDIYTLLDINEEVFQNFHLQAERVIDNRLDLKINRDIQTLKKIEERMLTNNPINIAQIDIDKVIKKVIINAKKNNEDMSICNLRELRILSYYLMKLRDDDNAYMYALLLLESNWRDLFFNGLSFYCLNTWNMIPQDQRILTCELLTKKLQAYNGSNKKYMEMKNYANLFDENGPRRLCELLSRKKQSVESAPSYFYNKLSTISQSYYSDVIIQFFDSNNIDDFSYIENIITLHKNERTTKLVLTNLILRVDKLGCDLDKTKLCKFANKILGDITLETIWRFNGATDREVQKLEKAKHLVNYWFKKRIIETFFEVCVQDKERKEFWINYVEYVNSFKIVGSMITKRILQGDERISDSFSPYYIETNSYNSTTSALVLFFKNKMIVEFSDMGALYVYKFTHEKVNLITKNKTIKSTDDLKTPSMRNLISYGVYNYEDGRMPHQGYWQIRLEDWMYEMIINK